MAVSNLTPATIYRALAITLTRTFIIDEADTFFEARDVLAGILNSGHTRATAYVLRCVGDDYDVERFCTWAPVVIARIGELNPALKTSSIEIKMQRARAEEPIERITPKIEPQLKKLHHECEQWANQHADQLRDADPEMPKAFRGRLADNWRPLLAIADLAGEDWSERARVAAKCVSGDLEFARRCSNPEADLASSCSAAWRQTAIRRSLCRPAQLRLGLQPGQPGEVTKAIRHPA